MGGDYPSQTIFPQHCAPTRAGGSIRLYRSSGLGWDLVGDELKAAVQDSINHKDDGGQLAGSQHTKWLVVVLDSRWGGTEAFHQFVEPPQQEGHWSQQTPGLFHNLDYRGLDEVWIVAMVDGVGNTLFLKLPTGRTPFHIKGSDPEAHDVMVTGDAAVALLRGQRGITNDVGIAF